MFKIYHGYLLDAMVMVALRFHRKRLLRTIEGHFCPELSYRLDAVDALLDMARGQR